MQLVDNTGRIINVIYNKKNVSEGKNSILLNASQLNLSSGIYYEAGPHRLILEFFDRLLGCHLAETGQIMREQRMDELRQTLLVQFAEITAAMDAELEELEAFEDTGE